MMERLRDTLQTTAPGSESIEPQNNRAWEQNDEQYDPGGTFEVEMFGVFEDLGDEVEVGNKDSAGKKHD